MTQKMLINAVDPEEVRIAILENGALEDFDIEARGVEQNKANIYLGMVTAVEPALNAAFVDYGTEKQGFLTANDVQPKLAHKLPAEDTEEERTPRISSLLKPRQKLLVQVAKDEVGNKGAVLTTYLSLAGRYVVLMPDSQTQGVSRKIEDEDARRRMRETAQKLSVPEHMGVIVRTAGSDRTKTELKRDLKFLLRLWEQIQKKANKAKAPALLYKEQDVIIRALRDYFTADIDEIIVDSDDVYDRAAEYMDLVMPKQRRVLTRYVERRPIFHHYRVEEQLEKIYYPRVPLPSGGSLVVEPTEALVSIDVNSGKQKSGDQEETALQTNTEAATEVARQLRLRDLGGIIVIDFIDMAVRKNRQKVEKALKDALKADRARVGVGRISRNGTLELTRQRMRAAVQKSVFGTCGVCRGTGHVLSPASHALSVLRRLRDRMSRGDLRSATVHVAPETAECLRTAKWSALQDLEEAFGLRVDIIAEHAFHAGQDDFTFETDPNAVVIPPTEPNFGPAPRLEELLEELADDGVQAHDDDDGDDDEEEDEEMVEGGVDSEEGKGRRRRRRRRSANAKKRRGDEEPAERRPTMRAEELLKGFDTGHLDLDLPSFEFVDLADLGRPPRAQRLEAGAAKSGAAATGSSQGRGKTTKRRPRRNTRGRTPRDRAASDGAASAARAAQPSDVLESVPTKHTPTQPEPAKQPEQRPSLLRRLLDWL